MDGPVVIIGAGLAGLQVAESLRHEKYEGPITLLGAEPHAPYNRPPLSKQWLREQRPTSTLHIRGLEAIARRHIDLRVRTTASAVDRDARIVHCADGGKFPYAGLALATGARMRTLPVPGVGLAGVHGLRTIDDAERIAAALARCAAR
ncbi:MAG TPA: FAD-dependent oxidoreductase, partial [Burkholderiaceae bacterium]|nr:FAD-dependent oxidoreductase [Burkholderiaceae bacterium]